MPFLKLLSLLTVAAVSACGTPQPEAQQQINEQMQAPVAAVREQMLVSAQWLADNLDNQQVIVLHVAASPVLYDTCHIPGALFLGWERITEPVNGVANELPPLEKLTAVVRELGLENGKRIVIYDEKNGVDAARVYFTLDYLGLGDNSSLLDGQLAAWKTGGYPLSAEQEIATASKYQPEINPQILVKMDDLLARINSGESGSDLLDCRPPEQFSGENPGKEIVRGGHIPGAHNMPVLNALVSKENPLLLGSKELRELYVQAGISPDRPVVNYCRTGHSASLSYFVLKYLGYDARLYDGSFIEWQSVENNPVE